MIPTGGMAVNVRALLTSPFMRFLMTGGFAALINILARLLFSLLFPFEIAVVVAYLIGMTTAYALARTFVFQRSHQSLVAEYGRFALVNAVALIQVWIVSVGLANWVLPSLGFTWQAELIAHTVGVLSPVFTSYFGHKVFTFKATDAPSGEQHTRED